MIQLQLLHRRNPRAGMCPLLVSVLALRNRKGAYYLPGEILNHIWSRQRKHKIEKPLRRNSNSNSRLSDSRRKNPDLLSETQPQKEI